MHKKPILFVLATMCVCAGMSATLISTATANAEFQPLRLTNLSVDLPVRYTDYSGKALTPKAIINAQVSDTVLTMEMTEEQIAWVAFDNSIYVCDASGTPTLGWAIIDLGQAALIDKLNVQFWNDHAYTDIVVQTSADVHFTQNVQTVFNSDEDGSVGQGKGSPYSYIDKRETLQTIDLMDSYNRFVRVTAKDTADGTTKFSRLEIMGATAKDSVESSADVLPVISSHSEGAYGTPISVALTNVNGKGEIYYTTDGSVPTENTFKYTGAIAINESTMLRAVVCVDGIFSEIREYTYLMQEVVNGANVALGKPATFYTQDFSKQMNYAGFNGASKSNMHLTDGSFDPTGSCVYTTEGLGWAVVDFGKVYTIEKVGVSFWHDWSMNAVIQLSETADFANPVTVFDGVHNNVTYASKIYTLDTPVRARYIRAYNNAGGRGYSVFSELEAYAYAEPFTVQAQEYVVSADGFTKVHEVVAGVSEAQAKAHLPTQITYTDSKGNTATAEGIWTGDFLVNEAGRYAFSFVSNTQIPTDLYGALRAYVVVLPAGDKSALFECIQTAEGVDKTLYTQDSLSVLQTALVVAQEQAGKILTQAEADQATTALQQALQALDMLGNTDELIALYERYASLRTQADYTQSNYTKNSFDSMQTQLQTVYEAVVENGNKNYNVNGVALLLADLQKAEKNLRERGDVTALASEVEKLSVLDVNAYTVSSWEVFARTMREVEVVLEADSANVTATEVQTAFSKLAGAIPVLRADTTALGVRYAQFADEYGTDSEDTRGMLKSTWFIYLRTMHYAEAILNDSSDVTQEQADTALADLNTAVGGLIAHGDKAQLRALADGSNYTESAYTVASYKAYATALAKAQALLSKVDSEVSQGELDEALGLLQTAVDGLIPLADKQALKQAVDTAEKTHINEYTATSVNAMLDALSVAKLLMDKEDATQAEVHEATTALQTAYNNLVALGNKTELMNLLETYNNLKEEQKDSEYYAYFLQALSYANAVCDSNEVSQADVDEAVRILKEAVANRHNQPKEGCGSMMQTQMVWLALAGVWAMKSFKKNKEN